MLVQYPLNVQTTRLLEMLILGIVTFRCRYNAGIERRCC